MTKRKWIGRALGLALCSTALVSCSAGDKSQQSNASASAQGFQWTHSAEKQLLEAIANAPANGLRPDLFLKGDLPKDDSERFAVLSQAGLKYAEALAHGYADPKTLTKDYTIPRPSSDVRQGLAQAIQTGKVGEWLASLPPQTDEYREMSKAHLAYLQMAQGKQFQPIAAGKPIKPGSRDPRAAAIAAALRSVGYLPPAQPNAAPEGQYGGPIVAAVKNLQADFGIKPDGIVGDTTRDALNLGPGGRARQLAIAMERLRWLQRDPPRTRIDVNTAAAFLDYFRDGAQVDHRNVIPGEPEKATPQLQASFFQLVANPKWRVPDSISEEEISKKSAAWLSENQFTQENGRWVQESGPKNSLGLVKLDLDDPQQIYLHDTPFKELFTQPERHRSHGCVRVQDAIGFASGLAQQDGVLDKFQEAMSSGDETYVKLKTKIPVRLLYHTAFWDGSRIQFRPDVYGWDDDVGRIIGLVKGPPRPSLQKTEDVGP
ncbi:MAG TPA: L,D-transpeptidase family protein [Sphingomicrobium sp.]